MDRLRAFLRWLVQPYSPPDKYVVRRCGWLWRRFAVYRVDIEKGVSGMCGDVELFYRVSPKYFTRTAAECDLSLQGRA